MTRRHRQSAAWFRAMKQFKPARAPRVAAAASEQENRPQALPIAPDAGEGQETRAEGNAPYPTDQTGSFTVTKRRTKNL